MIESERRIEEVEYPPTPTLEEAEQIIQNRLSYFSVPSGLRGKEDEFVDGDDYFWTIAEYNDENRRDCKGLPIMAYRSRQWLPHNPGEDTLSAVPRSFDNQFIHNVKYYTSSRWLKREYIPPYLSQQLESTWYNLAQKYPALNIPQERKDYLEKMISDRLENSFERAEYDEFDKQNDLRRADYDKIYQAAILISPLIEKTVIFFNNPFVITGYDYGSTGFSREGIKDIRYIEPEEIDEFKKQGYDGIVFEQYNWFIRL